ncbi:MAG: radical SAM family RiPP maturation amino acid epimerase [Candidatus Eremiobacteraeota bacterium]|nr:radical SAM family RiPP maturation amino acid epimerase [Candidatus Eremiobacteraeota bacterium]
MLALEFPAVLPYDSSPSEDVVRELAHAKRFLEYWSADPKFRQALPQDPEGVTAAAGLQANPIELRPLWDPQGALDDPRPDSLILQRYRSFMREKLAYRDFLRSSAQSSHAGFRAWRQRQMNRCIGEMGAAKGSSLVHALMAVELCKGCSVGCWFCGISALKLDGAWPYTETNQQLWRGVLEAARDLLGAGCRRGFCYWATDPLDNPDYEKFCTDFADQLGRFPQTTTAQPMRDPQRFRELHQLARRRGNEIDRFSILSLGMLKKVFAEYSAEELLFVELVMQMEGAYASKAFAGKARNQPARWKKAFGEDAPPDYMTSTIACVSGLLLRMPEQSFELITPTQADDRYPNGYRILARHSFDDAEEFRTKLKSVLDGLSARLPLDQPLRLRRDLRTTWKEGGAELVTHHLKIDVQDATLLRALAEGGRTATALALECEGQRSLEQTLLELNRLFSMGLLDEEP